MPPEPSMHPAPPPSTPFATGRTPSWCSARPGASAHPVDVRATRRRFRRGDTLLHAGDVGDVVRIEAGLVKLVVPSFDGRDRVLAVLGAGDLLGVEAALGHDAEFADAVALSGVTVVACDRATFVADLRDDPERALAVAQGVARRLRNAWTDQSRTYRPVVERLAAVMLELAERFGAPGHAGRRVLQCGLNHHAFAALIGAQRGSVSGAMAEFRRTRAAVGARGTYTIDPARLRALAGEAASIGFADDADAAPRPAALQASGGYTGSGSHTTTSTRAA